MMNKQKDIVRSIRENNFIFLSIERMNYINRPKEWYTKEEWIKYLEESIRELRKEKENLKKEKGELKSRLEWEIKKLREENEILRCNKGWTPEKVWHEEMIQYLMGENRNLKEELENTKKEFQQYKEHYNIEKDKQQIFLMTWRRY